LLEVGIVFGILLLSRRDTRCGTVISIAGVKVNIARIDDASRGGKRLPGRSNADVAFNCVPGIRADWTRIVEAMRKG
jgi:hypothetical protein